MRHKPIDPSSPVNRGKEEELLCSTFVEFRCIWALKRVWILLLAFGLAFFTFLYFSTTFFYNNSDGMEPSSNFADHYPDFPDFQYYQSDTYRRKLFPKSRQEWMADSCGDLSVEDENRLFPPNLHKYIGPDITLGNCSLLGHQLYHFASLYAIGRLYGRKPAIRDKTFHFCEFEWNEMVAEKFDFLDIINATFPIFARHFEIFKFNDTEIAYSREFGPDCCKYFDPQTFISEMKPLREKLLIIGHRPTSLMPTQLQHYKYFHKIRKEIRKIFRFSTPTCKTIEKYSNELFGTDESHKFCIFTLQRDDRFYIQESRQNFTEKTIGKVYSKLKRKFNAISVVLLGEDKEFLRMLALNRTIIPRIYLPKPMPAGEDMAFGALMCESLLITAPSSTSAFWIGYLMRDDAPVYYNANFKGAWKFQDNYLPEWEPISV